MSENLKKGIKKPWPTKNAMQQVYAKQLWGAGGTDFYSGEGSHLLHITQPYVDSIHTFLSSFETPPIVCDLGCGDFNIGQQLVKYTTRYVGIDIVPELIAYNQATFKNDKISFQCVDIAKDELPAADCALVRQVLQHLSNTEIQTILNKLLNYKYVIITEHVPQGDFIPNIDIISGQGTRLKKGSGVAIFTPPFEFMVKEKRELCAVDLGDGKGVVRTMLYVI